MIGDRDYASYMLRKLQVEVAKWGLFINIKKWDYIVVRDSNLNELIVGEKIINNTEFFKYLDVTLFSCNP